QDHRRPQAARGGGQGGQGAGRGAARAACRRVGHRGGGVTMGKLDRLMRTAGPNIDESMGAGGGEPITAPATSTAPARWMVVPAPAPRPDPVTFDLGDGCTVTVRWRTSGGPDLIQALRRVLKLAQERRRAGEAA